MNITKFKELFKGRNDAYGLQNFCLKEPLTEKVLASHLSGEKRIGIYPIYDGKNVNWAAVDIDEANFEKATQIVNRCQHYNLNAYIERSKSKGFHIWLFFDSPILAVNIRLVLEMILHESGFNAEIFPKQDEVFEDEFGNYIYLPLFGADTSKGRTVFVNLSNEIEIKSSDELFKIKINSAKIIEDIVSVNNLQRERTLSAPVNGLDFKKLESLPCITKMLEGGLKEGNGRNEVAFRLAIFYKDRGLIESDIYTLLTAWNLKNIEPLKDRELFNTIQSVLSGKYKGIGCENAIIQNFCDKNQCPIIQARERKQLIEEGVILLTFRDKTRGIMSFSKKGYEYRLTNIMFSKDGRFKALLTLSKDRNLVYKDFIDLEHSNMRKRFAKIAKDPEVDIDLIKIDELVRKQITKETEEEKSIDKQLYVMTEVEKKEAMNFLEKNPDMLYQVIRSTNQMGAVGEEQLRCMVYLCFTSRITMEPMSLTVKGESASGKSFICQCVKKLIPEEGYKFMTRATQQAFYHLEEDGMQHRIFYINELPGSESADYSIRSAQSEGDLILMITKKNMQTGDMETAEKRVKGPVGFLLTTTKASIFDENETRNFSVYTDDSPALTRQIGEITIRKALGETFALPEPMINLFKNFQRLLNPEFKIAIPYSAEIFGRFPDKPVRIRRDRERFRALIEIITLFHQFHRKQYKENGQTILEATLADYYLAKRIGAETLLHTIYEIGPASKTIWSALNDLRQKFEMESPAEEFNFKYKDISEYLDWKKDKTKKWTLTLYKAGLIEYSEESSGGRGKQAIFKISKLGQSHTEELTTVFLPSIEDLWEKFPCKEDMFYDPFKGWKINPLTADAPIPLRIASIEDLIEVNKEAEKKDVNISSAK